MTDAPLATAQTEGGGPLQPGRAQDAPGGEPADGQERRLWEDLKDAIRSAFPVFGDPAAIAALGAFRPLDAWLLREWLDSFEAAARALLTAMAMRMIPTLAAQKLRPRSDPSRSARSDRAVPAGASARAGAQSREPAADPGGGAAAGPSDAPGARPVADRASGAFGTTCADDHAAGGGAEGEAGGEAPSQPPGSETWTGLRFRLVPGGRKAGAKTRARGSRSRRRQPGSLVPTLALARRFEALIRVVIEPEPWARRLARRLAGDRYLAARTLARPKPRRCPDTGHDRPIPYADILEDALSLAWAALRGAAAAADTG